MMRIIVVSDTHRNSQALQTVIDRHRDADLFLHLGDGADEFSQLAERYPELKMQGVTGNCDFRLVFRRDSATVSCGAAKIFYTHGHRYNVKRGREELMRAAREAGANVILYGHTHVARLEYIDDCHLMNPGSLSEPRVGEPSYGVVDVTEKEIVCRIVPLQLPKRWDYL